ncbi:MAG: MotA/TolQ/ExbB proton channel family protein [Verrucomicrobiota bacterium]
MKRSALLLLALLAPLSQPLLAQDQVARQLQAQVEAALQDLATQRQAIAAERIPLEKEITERRGEIEQARRVAEIARLKLSDRQALLAELARRQAAFEANRSYLHGQLDTYRANLLAQLHPAANQALGPALDAPSSADSLAERLQLLETGLTEMERALGGQIVPGQASDSSGTLHRGRFLLLGPESYFLSQDGQTVGAAPASSQARARLYPLGTPAAEIASLLDGASVELPVDFSGGRSHEAASLSLSFSELVQQGGLWVWPILALALLASLAALVKFVQVGRLRQPPPAWTQQLLDALGQGHLTQAESLARSTNHPAGSVLLATFPHAAENPEAAEETIYEHLLRVQQRLQSWLPFIAVTAAATPLIGLLGTVSGIIRTFGLLTIYGTGDPKPLAGGISEALVTTLFGLVVAIPALILHSLLSRRVQGILQTTERLGLAFVNGLRTRPQP